MHAISSQIADVLVAVAAILPGSGQWDGDYPIQQIFLPRMKQIP
jgi:hypothetical protein